MQMNERLSHCSDGVILMYDKNNVETKKNVVNKWLPMIQKINENRIRKIPVCIIGNKSDTGGKHTLRYASLPYDTSNVTLYTMSLKHETCVQYDNTIFSKWKSLFKHSQYDHQNHDELMTPLLYLKENIDRR